jgi:ABC-type multidrug transport system ATPase subunit
MTTPSDVWRDDDELVVSRYPYPLAATYNRAFALPEDDTEAHDYLLDLVWVTLKYFATLAVAQYLSDGAREPKLNQALLGLQRPSLGHWNGWLRDVLAAYRRDGTAFAVPELDRFYAQRQAGQVAAAAQALLGELHSLGSDFVPRGPGWTTEDVLWLLIGYRNRIAAGRGGSDLAARRRVAALLQPLVGDLYAQMGFLADYRLVYVRSVTLEDDGHGAVRNCHALTLLTGHTPRVVREPLVLDHTLLYHRVYLLDRHESRLPLSLHPLLLYAPCPGCKDRDQAFILNGGDDEALDYVSYQCAHHIRRADCARDLRGVVQTLARRDGMQAGPEKHRIAIAAGARRLVFEEGREVWLGRDPSADVCLDDPRVSRRHAVIRFREGSWVLEDAGSRLGTFHEGRRIERQALAGSAATAFSLGGPDAAHIEVAPLDEAPPPPPPPRAAASATAERATPAPQPLAVSPPPPPLGERPGPGGTGDGGTVPVGPGPGLLSRRERLSVGRAQGNDIVLSDPLVSRHHAELRHLPGRGYELRDLGSLNGTFVNGRRVTGGTAVAEGDLVTIGRQRFRLLEGTLQAVASGDLGLEVHDLTVRTPQGQVLLDHVSFPLEKHSFLAVVGPSGAGKTTLVGAMTGFNPASEGTVYYGGLDLYANYDDLRRSIGYVPQDDIIHTQLTVRQALSYTAELRFSPDVSREERARRVDEVMAELGLTERAELVIERLSGGQRKRANIGVELITSPSPLFLDEPTSGLDPGMEKSVMALLRQLADGGRTVIIVTHSSQSLHLCDRILFLAPGGRVAFFGPPGDALRYFGKTDFADVFLALEQQRDVGWDQRFRASSEWQTYVRQPLADREIQSGPRAQPAVPAQPSGAWRHQAKTLTRRYLSVIAADRRNLALLLLQAPVLALLMIAALGSGAFDRSAGYNPLAQMVVTVAVLTITLTGLLNSIREIVKEFPIYRRERFVGLSIGAYVISKVGVLAPLVVIQAIILAFVGLARQPVDGSAPVLGSPGLELVVDLTLIGLAAMALGLMVSAMMRSNDKAISVLVLLVVAELVMSMPVLEVWTKPLLGQLSWLSSANWGVDGVASTVNLNAVQPPRGGPNPAWASTPGAWLGSVAMLLVLTLGGLAATWWLLRRRDPSLLSAPRRRAPAAGAMASVPPQPA